MNRPAWVTLFVALALSACTQKPATGPGEVRWDRDTCAHCVMAISDRHFSAQVRGGPADVDGNLHKFDDLGCAVNWLSAKPWKDDPGVEIWVNDHRDGQWIDARTALYLAGAQSPMDYGLAAQRDAAEGAVNFAQACERIARVVAERERGSR